MTTAPGPARPAFPEPPRDIPAEQATLGALLLSPPLAQVLLPQLRPRQFSSLAHAELLEVMQQLHRTGEPVDPLTVHAELRRRGRTHFGGRQTAVVLHDLLAATPIPANGRYHAALVAEAAARRRVAEAGVRLVQLAEPGHRDLDQLLSDAQRELAGIRAAVERHHALQHLARDQAMPAVDRSLRAVADPDRDR